MPQPTVDSSAQPVINPDADDPATGTALVGGRLKYADPRSLPSFPSTGLPPNGAAAGAAATLGWSIQKSAEVWKPGKASPASSAAAIAAKDSKLAAQREVSSKSAGAKAALLAVGSASTAVKEASSRSAGHDSWGNSAAAQAFHASRSTSTPTGDRASGGLSAATQAHNVSRAATMRAGHSAPTNEQDDLRPLSAAKGAMAQTRRRALSQPSVPTLTNRASVARATTSHSNALSGATSAHRASMLVKTVPEGGAVPVTTMTRDMFTSHPPVKLEVDEKTKNEQLHESAVSMARKIFIQQQKMADQAKDGKSPDGRASQAGQYVNLQDAAYKQAQERLAKLTNEHQKHRELQEYYGNSLSPRRRFSMFGRIQRDNEDSDDEDLNDRQRSEKIRKQMSLFSNKLSEVDSSKRRQDGSNVLAAAQRNVKAQMQSMDEKVSNDTGRIRNSKLSDWERAQQEAHFRREARNTNKGKIDVGAGRFMDPEEVNAIASKRIQPVIDDINEKAAVERERRLAVKMEEDAKKEEDQKKKARDREVKEINAHLKEEEKQQERAQKEAKKLEEKNKKAEEKARKESEKAAKAEEKRQAKEENRKSKSIAKKDISRPLQVSSSHDIAANNEPVTNETEQTTSREAETHSAVENEVTEPEDETEPAGKGSTDASAQNSPSSKVKGWLRNRLSRGKSVTDVGSESKRRSFFGGSFPSRGNKGRGGDMSGDNDKKEDTREGSLDLRSSSMRDVALAGKGKGKNTSAADDEAEDVDEPERDSMGVSPISSKDDLETTPTAELSPPPHAVEDPLEKSGSGSGSSRAPRFKEELSP